MSTVNDVLNGNTSLLQQDDVAVVTTSLPYNNNNQNADYVSQILPFTTSNSNLTSAPAVQPGQSGNNQFYSGNSVLSASASGRMFNNGNDVVMTVGVTNECGDSLAWQYSYFNPVTSSKQNGYCLKEALLPNATTVVTRVVMGDFQGDNLVLPLMFVQSNFENSPKEVLWQMNIVTASINQVDVIDPYGGQQLYSEDDTGIPYPIGSTLVVGDFNNDGIDEIAVLFSDFQTVKLYKVTLPALTIAPYRTIKLPQPLKNGTLAAGRFGSSGNVSLAAVGQASDESQATVDFIDPATSPATIVPTTYSVSGLNSSQFHLAFAQAAPVVNWSSSTVQQLVLGLSYEYNSWHTIEIGTFDTTHTFHVQGEEGQNGCLFGMQVGNYNHQTSSSSSNSQGFADNIDPNLQIILLQSNQPGSQCAPPYADNFVHLTVDNVAVPSAVQQNPQSSNPPPATNWFTQASDIVPNLGPYTQLTSISVIDGDFQGRSLRLGAPEKITLTSHTQPDFVLGMPPMHVDWVNPSNLTTEECEPNTLEPGKNQCVVNLTVKPYAVSTDRTTAFTSSFTTENTDISQSSRKSTSSWGLAAKQTETASATYGIPQVGSISGSITTSAGNVYKNVHSQYDSQYGTATDSLSTSTGYDDDVYFTSENQNLFSYPILGKQDADGNPLYVTYSVPSQVNPTLSGGSTQEWYQPIHEPGNLLSYPSSEAQLKNEYAPGHISPVTGSTCINLSGNPTSTTVSWGDGNKTTTASGWNDAVSADVKVSVSASVKATVLTDGVGGSLSGSVDVSGSGSWGALNQSSTTMESSNAVEVTAPAFNGTKLADFGYAYESVVFGYGNANAPYQNPTSILPANLDVMTTGPLFAGFIANPIASGPGLNCGQPGAHWWSNVYTKPDVGFNHPTRWDISTDNVASFNAPEPPSADNALIDQPFYQMKGLFITTNPSGTTALGSIVNSVKAGDQVKLTARVYNFSLVATNALTANSTVHVRFYGQKKCPNVYPNSPVRDLCPNGAFLIPATGQSDGDYIISSIPGFNQTSPNWELATVTFDTTGYDDAELIFWVVTWIEDGSGNVVTEMPGHGVKMTSFAGKTFANITDIALDGHSNNVGMYGTYTPFYVIPATTSTTPATLLATSAVAPEPATAAPVATSSASQLSALKSIDLQLPSKTLPVDKKSRVLMTFSAEKSFAGSTVRYYDGDPNSGGKLFDFQTVHELAPETSTTTRVFFRPERCGPHTLYAISDLEDFPETIGKISTIVKVDPATKVKKMLEYIDALQLPKDVREPLVLSLKLAHEEFASGSEKQGLESLQVFQDIVHRLLKHNGDALEDQANTLLAQTQLIRRCEKDLEAYNHR